jgi:hypothetical protein
MDGEERNPMTRAAWESWLRGYLKNEKSVDLKTLEEENGRSIIKIALELFEGNVSRASDFLKINRSTLMMRLKSRTEIRRTSIIALADSRNLTPLVNAVRSCIESAEKILTHSELRVFHDRCLEVLGEKFSAWTACSSPRTHDQDHQALSDTARGASVLPPLPSELAPRHCEGQSLRPVSDRTPPESTS